MDNTKSDPRSTVEDIWRPCLRQVDVHHRERVHGASSGRRRFAEKSIRPPSLVENETEKKKKGEEKIVST